MTGELFILSAPSGGGKTTLINRLMGGALAEPERVAFSVSHTTREPRTGEVDGVDYHFVGMSVFEEMIAEGSFLEWAEVYGHHYGTSYAAVMPRLEAGFDVILDIDVKGAEQVMSRRPSSVGVFVMPPSYRDLERRLKGRGLDSPEAVRRRLEVSLWEIRRYDRYQYVIINDDADRAAEALASVIQSRRHRGERLRARAAKIVEDFENTFRPDQAGAT